MEFDLDVISQALQVLLEATLPILAAMAAAWLKSKYDVARSELSESQQILLDGIVRVAVFAAEQLKATEYIDNKLDYAVAYSQAQIDKLGLSISVGELRARIEAAVKEQFPH